MDAIFLCVYTCILYMHLYTLYKQNVVFFQGAPDLSVIVEHMPNVFIFLAEVWYM